MNTKTYFDLEIEAADAGDRNSQLKVANTYKKEWKLDEALHYFKLAFFNTDPSEMEQYCGGAGLSTSDTPKRESIQKQIDSVEQMMRERSNPYSPSAHKKLPLQRQLEESTETSSMQNIINLANEGDRNAQLQVAEAYRQERKLDEALHYFKLAFFNTDPSEIKSNPWGSESGAETGNYRTIIQKKINAVEFLIRERSNPYSPMARGAQPN